MTALYLTADEIGIPTGGGSVTYQESLALKEFAGDDIQIVSRKEILSSAQKNPLKTPLNQEPWVWDHYAYDFFGNRVKLAHVYAGTFTKSVKKLKDSGALVTYTAAAHDVEVSKREHEKLGILYNYPHLTDPELFKRYLGGYAAADVLVVPSKHSERVMRSFGCTNRIEVIPHGVDLPAETKPFPERFTIGYLGACGPDKGLIYLLQAWKKLNYSDATLLIAGRDSTSNFMINLVNQYGGGNIVLMGWVNKVSDFYNQLSLYVQPSACLLPGTPVYSDRGFIPIENLGVGDKVLVDSGHYRRVISPIKSKYRGDLILIRTTGFNEAVAMTGSHRILVIRRGLADRKAHFLEKRRVYEEVMRMRCEEKIGSYRISQRTGVHPQTIESWFRGTEPHDGRAGLLNSLREDVLHKKPEWMFAKDVGVGDVVLFPRCKEVVEKKIIPLPKKVIASNTNGTSPLPDYLELDEDAMRTLGFYVSEGCAGSGGDVIFCFHAKEKDFIEHTRVFLSDRLGLRTRVRFNGNKATVSTNSILLSNFLADNFGRGAHNKTIPQWVFLLPEWQLSSFLRGCWEGDGSSWAVNKQRRLSSYSTVSKSLAYQIFNALVRLGFMPKLYKSRVEYSIHCCGNQTSRLFRDILKRTDVSLPVGKKGYRTYIDDDFYYMPITSVSELAYVGDVYNLEVDERHCYCAPFVVHNSEGFGCEVLEAMAHDRPVICSDGAGAVDVVPVVFRSHAGDVDDLVNKIDVVKQGRLLWDNWQQTAGYYTWDKIRQRYVDLWKELVK